MDGLIFILLLIIAGLLMIGIPLGLSFLILKFVKRRNYDRRVRLIALAPIFVLAYFIFTAIFPTETFYKKDFKEVTGIDFPMDGELIYKTATFPDYFGDYGSTALVKVDKGFYEHLGEKLKIRGLKEEHDKSSSFALNQVLDKIGDKKIENELSLWIDGGVFYYVGFLSDKETLIVHRQSW